MAFFRFLLSLFNAISLRLSFSIPSRFLLSQYSPQFHFSQGFLFNGKDDKTRLDQPFFFFFFSFVFDPARNENGSVQLYDKTAVIIYPFFFIRLVFSVLIIILSSRRCVSSCCIISVFVLSYFYYNSLM